MLKLSQHLFTRRRVLGAGIAAALTLAWQRAAGQSQAVSALPDRAITLLVPFAAGGATDVVARLVAQHLGQYLQRSVVVENVGGGGGTVGAARVARAAADGTTLLMATIASHVLNPLSMPNVSYNPEQDFTPISLVATVPCVLLVNPAVPAHSVQELVALLKSQPGQFSYASSGVGTPTHLSGELFKALTGVQMTHIPYKGGGRFRACAGRHHPRAHGGVSRLANDRRIRCGGLRILDLERHLRPGRHVASSCTGTWPRGASGGVAARSARAFGRIKRDASGFITESSDGPGRCRDPQVGRDHQVHRRLVARLNLADSASLYPHLHTLPVAHDRRYRLPGRGAYRDALAGGAGGQGLAGLAGLEA